MDAISLLGGFEGEDEGEDWDEEEFNDGTHGVILCIQVCASLIIV